MTHALKVVQEEEEGSDAHPSSLTLIPHPGELPREQAFVCVVCVCVCVCVCVYTVYTVYTVLRMESSRVQFLGKLPLSHAPSPSLGILESALLAEPHSQPQPDFLDG
jgi:hypothetical protein